MSNPLSSSGGNNRGQNWPYQFCIHTTSTRPDWRRFKDLMRRVLDGQPGWTDCSDTDASFYWLRYRGYVTCASVTVRSTRDADIAWEKLTRHVENGQLLLVHLYDSSSEPNARLVKCNCDKIFPTTQCTFPPMPPRTAAPSSGTVVHTYAAAPSVTYPSASQYYSGSDSAYVTSERTMAALTDGFANLHTYQNTYPPGTYYGYHIRTTSAAASAPTYVHNTNSMLPVNASNGLVQAEHRGIHISKLPYSFDEQAVRNLIIRIAGMTPRKVTLHTDRATRKSTAAVAEFSTGEEAIAAVQELNGYKVKRCVLEVRLDRNATPITPTPPAIVDSSAGSTAY